MGRRTKLPRRGDWEVGIRQFPDLIVDGEDIRGVLVVVELESKAVRMLSPLRIGQPVDDAVRACAQQPDAPARPSRPCRIHCEPALVDALADVAHELRATIVPVERLGAVDAAAEALSQRLAVGRPFLPRAVSSWRTLVDRMVQVAPWRGMPDSVAFRFPDLGGVLAGAVAVVFGDRDQQHGLTVFASAEGMEAFYANAGRSLDVLEADFCCWCVHLDLAGDCEAEQVRAAAGVGLLWGGRVLQLFALTPDGMRPVSSVEEPAIGDVLTAVLDIIEAHRDALIRDPTAVSMDGNLRVEGMLRNGARS